MREARMFRHHHRGKNLALIAMLVGLLAWFGSPKSISAQTSALEDLAPRPCTPSQLFQHQARALSVRDGTTARELLACLSTLPAALHPDRFVPNGLETTLPPPAQDPTAHDIWHLLLGRRASRDGRFELAEPHFRAVRSGEARVRALLHLAAISVRARRGIPAVQALLSALQALESPHPSPNRRTLREQAKLSLARIYLSSSLILDPETNLFRVDSQRISAARKYYHEVFPIASDATEVAYELSVLSHYAGLAPEEGGLLRLLLDAGFASPRAAQALAQRAAFHLSHCREAAAKSDLEIYTRRFEPLQSELATILEAGRRNAGTQGFVTLLTDASRWGPEESPLRVQFESLRAEPGIAASLAWLRRLDRAISENRVTRAVAGPLSSQQLESALLSERGWLTMHLQRLVEQSLVAAHGEAEWTNQRVAELRALEVRPVPEQVLKSRVTQAESQVYGVAFTSNLLIPFRSALPNDYRSLESGYFFQPSGSACAR